MYSDVTHPLILCLFLVGVCGYKNSFLYNFFWQVLQICKCVISYVNVNSSIQKQNKKYVLLYTPLLFQAREKRVQLKWNLKRPLIVRIWAVSRLVYSSYIFTFETYKMQTENRRKTSELAWLVHSFPKKLQIMYLVTETKIRIDGSRVSYVILKLFEQNSITNIFLKFLIFIALTGKYWQKM